MRTNINLYEPLWTNVNLYKPVWTAMNQKSIWFTFAMCSPSRCAWLSVFVELPVDLVDRNEHQLYSGEFGRRSDLEHFFIWKRAMKLQKIRGRKTEALNFLKNYGITTVPCFLWSNNFDDSSNLTSGADRLHHRNLGFPKRIQNSMIVDGSIFGGLVQHDIF